MKFNFQFQVTMMTIIFSLSVFAKAQDPSVSVEELSDFPVLSKQSIIANYSTVDNKVYCFGGATENSGFTNDFYDEIRAYDLITNTWSELAFTMPYEIGMASTASFYNNHFYVPPSFATGNSNGWGSHNSIIDVDLFGGTATEVVEHPANYRIWGVNGYQVADKIFYFGGHTGSDRTDIVEYNIAANTMTVVANMSVSRTMVLLHQGNDGWIYIINDGSTIERFDPTSYVVETMTADGTGILGENYFYNNSWHIPEENAIYFFKQEAVGDSSVVYKYDYVNDQLENSGISLAGAYTNVFSIKDENDAHVIYSFKRHASLENTVTLCKLTLSEGTTSFVSEDPSGPSSFILNKNYPNPFNPSTTIRYGLHELAEVTVKIYDLNGREVWNMETREQAAGWYDLTWNGLSKEGTPVPTGMYIAQIKSGAELQTIKMAYLK